MTAPEAFTLFKEKFNLKFNEYMDPIMSIASGMKPCLDVVKFDDWLHEKYGNYEATGHSMQSLLVEKYGQETADQVQQLLG